MRILNRVKARFERTRKRKRISVLNGPENVSLHFDEDNLPPMPPLEGTEEVKLELEESITERIKLNPGKRKITRTELTILTPNLLFQL